ncbi:MAG: U32 family peptidase [Ruminococcus flavefaciens]|nr:U32 family peptidase [Ruminococcus flavefaciens]
MIGKNVELLAPAGNYQALIGAVNAGADAVYLGGDKFSARAYADNFTTQEIIKAIRYTHICGKKLYLTLNTLVKENEISLIYDYLRPLYESGLDGIIIQDLGVWRYVRENFPYLPLHASTQMTITGVRGASLLKKSGAARIVPARELSLNEIKDIKENTGLEIECFIHGAMCYCYSGQCLFSSILGGRSGNRGRCAQPCRLPYKVSGTSLYPLSLKDMCTIEYIPQLIDAGIDSFKIEGRMKKPEYAAGVTAIYRKYIDKYYDKGKASYNVDKADMDRLYKLYIRSEVQTGYYDKHNAKEMITLGKGSYLGSDEALLMEISKNYLKEEKKFPISISGTFEVGKSAVLNLEGMGITQTTYGETVQCAMKRPMTREDVLKQLSKMGNSNLYIVREDITVGDYIFIPNAQLNELRRTAVRKFEDKIIEANGFKIQHDHKYEMSKSKLIKMQSNLQNFQNLVSCQIADINNSNEKQNEKPIKRSKNHNQGSASLPVQVNVRTLEQLWAVCEYSCDRIYIESDLYIKEFDQIGQCLKNRTHFAIFLSLPYIIRARDEAYLEQLKLLLNDRIQGFLVRNLEEIIWILSLESKEAANNETKESKNNWIEECKYNKTSGRTYAKYEIVTDSGVYCYNSEALRYLQEYVGECYIPWELNSKELKQLISGEFMQSTDKRPNLSLTVYGTIPMMITANCIKKTTDSCTVTNTPETMYLTDRYNTRFPVLCNCKHCYNIIYNSVPYSLHQEWKNIRRSGLFAVRLDFVFENKEQVEEILKYYTGQRDTFPVNKYTSGHYKRGVE